MIQKNEITVFEEPFVKKATVYRDPDVQAKAVILYFHGGGLLYGNREDLPDLHLQMMIQAGFQIVAFDYPLAPASDLPEIKADVLSSIEDYIDAPAKYLADPALPYFLWGRSAGAYLALLAASFGKFQRTPAGVLSYYGYGFLTDHWYDSPSRYYLTLPKVPESCLGLIPKEKHAVGDLDTHYSVYVYARQTGRWKALLYQGRDKYFYTDYSLRLVDHLPCPLFATHATGDTDIPYPEYTALCERLSPEDHFVAASDTHDFDRNTEDPFAEAVLRQSIKFMNRCL